MQNWGGLSFFPPSHCPRDCEGIQHEILTEDSVVLSPTGDGTAICTVRGHLSHLNIELFTSIDVKLIFDIARLGLFSSANILQIAHVALLAVLAMLLAIISPSSHS